MALTKKPTVVLLQKIAAPRLFVRFLRSLTEWFAYEIDDAIYFGYPGSADQGKGIARRVSFTVSLSDRVVTSNRLIAADVRQWTMWPERVRVFPGPAPTPRTIHPGDKRNESVLWLGSPSTYPYFVKSIGPICAALADSGYRISVVGSPSDSPDLNGVEQFEWSESVEEHELRSASIGVMPMATDDWALRKAGYKILEYLASEIVPVYVRSEAIDTLLGDRQEVLSVAIPDDSPESWATGVERASRVQTGDVWHEMRDEVFDEWSPEKFAASFLPVHVEVPK